MANAVLVERVQAATALNAVLVHDVKATSTPPVLNAVLVHKLGTVVSNAAPVANAGAPQTAVEPWSTVTLAGTGSTDNGTVATYTWTRTAGPTVTLSGTGASRTFTAPASMDFSTLTFSLVVADNAGLVSTPDFVTVTVLPATEFKRVSGAWVPVRVRSRKAGAWV